MTNLTISVFTFVLLSLVAFLTMYFHSRLPERYRDAETAATVSKIANIFVVITSLVFGLLITSSKNTFEAIDRNQHNYGTDLILLDRVLRDYGADANGARNRLIAYAEEALAHPARVDEIERTKQDRSGGALDAVGTALNAIHPADPFHQGLLSDARNHYHDVVHLRWVIVEQSEGSLPTPILGMLLAWLTLIFASYGYRAPPNIVVVSMLLISAALMAASVYLVLDMNVPFKGPIQISDQPIRRALNEMQTP
jgi:hypothetical protein